MIRENQNEKFIFYWQSMGVVKTIVCQLLKERVS